MLRIVLPFLVALALGAQSAEGLRYRMQVWMRGEGEALETRFTLRGIPATRTHNKVQKPRMGGWRLEADRKEGTPYAQALLLARAERLLYLAGPAPQTRAEPIALRFGTRSLPVWSLEVPRNLKASVVLVEIAPRLLALCDLSARFDQGDVARVELHLEQLEDTQALGPAEAGMALLGTLGAWAREVAPEAEGPVTVR